MILLDTNVVSELMRPEPTAAVLDWVDRQDATDLYLSAVSAAELRTGVALLPPGRRRDRLLAALEAMIEHDFSGRLLPFDSPAARSYAGIFAARRAAGRPILEADCQIASIAACRGMAVATRNIADFADCGIAVIDPWRQPD